MLSFNRVQMQLILLALQVMLDNLQCRICEFEELPFTEVSDKLDVLVRAWVDYNDIMRTLEGVVHE